MAFAKPENRRFHRVPLSFSVSGKLFEHFFKGHKFIGETLDVSFDGLGIRVGSNNGFKEGQRIKFETKLYPGDFSIKARGIVCWVNSQDDDNWPISLGVKLTRLRHYGIWCERIENRMLATS